MLCLCVLNFQPQSWCLGPCMAEISKWLSARHRRLRATGLSMEVYIVNLSHALILRRGEAHTWHIVCVCLW